MQNKEGITVAELAAMREQDIQSVDPATLIDIATVHINKELSKKERAEDYIRQIKNPYCYLCNGIVVKVSFAGKRSLEDCLKDAMFGEN